MVLVERDMDSKREIRFEIDVFKPNTLPMARLAEYLSDLAKLYGHESEVHFDRLEEGSVKAIAYVDEPAHSHVRARIASVGTGLGPDDAMKAYNAIDRKLAADKATGKIVDVASGNVIKFPGRERPQPIHYGTFTETLTLQGKLISLQGADDTKHAQLEDGDRKYTRLQSRNLELMERLKHHLWGNVRLHGRGRFERLEDGTWDMKAFNIDDFDVLGRDTFADTIAKLRAVPNGLKVDDDVWQSVADDRLEDEQS